MAACPTVEKQRKPRTTNPGVRVQVQAVTDLHERQDMLETLLQELQPLAQRPCSVANT